MMQAVRLYRCQSGFTSCARVGHSLHEQRFVLVTRATCLGRRIRLE